MRPFIRRQNDFIEAASLTPHFEWRTLRIFFALIFLLSCLSRVGGSQCSGIASTPGAVADCAAHAFPQGAVIPLDTTHTYSLAELIDLAERNNPATRIAWERARQRAEELGIAKSSYYPLLAGQAVFADSRVIEPFPKPLAPRGYVMVEAPVVVPEVTLDYLIFDFGKREARVDAATAAKLAAGANFIQANQTVAFRVASAYYQLLTQQERLAAAEATLKTAQTTADAADFQLRNGRSTLLICSTLALRRRRLFLIASQLMATRRLLVWLLRKRLGWNHLQASPSMPATLHRCRRSWRLRLIS